MSAQLPTPWSLSEIKPELLVFGCGGKQLSPNLTHEVNIKDTVSALKEAEYLSTQRIVFVTHGFKCNSKTQWLHTIKDEMLQQSDQTVVIVGWGRGAELPPFKYSQAASNVDTIGSWIAGFAAEIKKRLGNSIKIWGIGHGLGAHLMGIAGRMSGAFYRITGLDPAGPCFEGHGFEEKRLSKKDSPFVDVIHTDSYHPYKTDLLTPVNHYGTLAPMGSLDFYVNYGFDQPNAGDFTTAGNHIRAIELFLWSIENPGELKTNLVLVEEPNEDKPVKKTKRVVISAEMGYYADFGGRRPTGSYYIETNGSIPWK